MEVKEKQLPDILARNTAGFDFNNNIVVQAGAGTGKTTLLTDRLCYLILGHKADDKPFTVENIVALTFTEKAASEIKFRVADKLGNIISILSGSKSAEKDTVEFIGNLKSKFSQKSEDILENAKKNLSLLDRSQISTIHSFASYIIKTFALDAGVCPSFEVDDGRHFYEIFRSEFSNWLSFELGWKSPHKDKWKYILKHIELEDLNIFAQNLCSAKLEKCKKPNSKDFLALYKNKLADILYLKDKYFENTRAEAIKNSLIAAQKAIEDLTKAIETDDFTGGQKINIPQPSKPSNWDETDWEKAKSVIMSAGSANVFSQHIVSEIFELLTPFANAFRPVYEKKSFISFDGLLVKCRNLLKNNIAVRSRLKKQFCYILIDEFQDTDPLQGEIILFLGEKAGTSALEWRKVELERGKLFVVGDDKQSIYRFRGADIRAYDKFTKLMEQNGAVKCFLQTNFRSQPSLIEPINAVVSKVMQKDETQAEYVPIFAHRKALAEDNFELALAGAGIGLKSDDYRAVQADFIADWIYTHQGKPLYGERKSLRLRDIAILFRSTGCLGIYIQALKNKGISYSVEEKKYFYSTQEIIDLVNLLTAILDPDDKISLTGVLRSPLAAFTDSDIYKIKKSALLDYRKKVPLELKNLNRLYLKLRKFNEICRRSTPADFINIVLKETYAFEMLSHAYNSEQTISNIFKFISIISDMETLSCQKLSQLLNPSKDFTYKAKEGESPLADEFLDAVNIMTIHKSKGLEFPVVIIADINSGNKPVYVKNDFISDWDLDISGFCIGGFKDIAYTHLEERETKHSNAEEVRNFYVALTRAKDKLILVGNNRRGKPRTMAGYLGKSLVLGNVDSETAGIKGSSLPIGVSYIEEKLSKPGHPIKHKTTVKDIDKWSLLWQNRINEYEKLSVCQVFSSATSLKKETQKKEFKGSVEKREFGALLGTLCHKVLQMHNFNGKFCRSEIDVLLPTLTLDLKEENIDLNELSRETFKILSTFAMSNEYKKIALSEIITKELPFDYVHNDNGNSIIMRGIIDLIIKSDKGIEIIDYKSETVSTGREKLHAQEFKEQCGIYKNFVSKLFPDLPICSKVLFLRTAKSVEV